MKKLPLTFALTIIFSSTIFNLNAQSDVDLFVEDMLFLADGFASPASESAAYQGTAGWFTSAAALEKWKVDVSVHGNALFVPSSKKQFTVNNNDFKILRLMGNASGAEIPTAFGADSDVQFEGELDYLGQTLEITNFQAIEGIDKGALVYPFVQVSVGLPLEFELGVRALPELEVDGSKFSTYGVALKHNFSQYFRFNEPDDLQLAGIISYNLFDVKYEFTPISVEQIVNLNLIDVNANVFMAEFMASKKYGNFEIFGALGLVQSDFKYEFDGSGVGLGLINSELTALEDSEAQFKGDIGFNLLFDRFKISTMATAGNFFNINMGLHFIL